jgi:hypothetical protein
MYSVNLAAFDEDDVDHHHPSYKLVITIIRDHSISDQNTR